ncbi:uncharacterized protein CTHT_0044950 [Thermochaetoides thermophila DSM 1495]|uniref:Uncharacterized protein n=1 Tax=Chaetomium thermophilum (strain DSM 1495 / CBS 144.50 / IMI 039719) TaxID=759272 RepID=G0S987_CHATD|nr:hypothetical protein CTHT_0044950 [Thermochaetoides thermophila DSM 1495]EGS19998.1 hypothetical protein CTHT_0044950 [Thermochaetoides thermophila DSM 1495]
MARIRISFAFFLCAILSLATLASASVPTFCKCTCFKNSTIIPLGPQKPNQPPPQPPATTSKPPSTSTSTPRHHLPNPQALDPLQGRAASSSCSQCNRAFCLSYNLPICKDAEEKDVVASCFQRDSRKDRVIVWGFIVGTAGLLGWAGMRRVIFEGEKPFGFGGGRRRESPGGGRGGGSVGGIGGGGVSTRGGGVFARRTAPVAEYNPLEGEAGPVRPG